MDAQRRAKPLHSEGPIQHSSVSQNHEIEDIVHVVNKKVCYRTTVDEKIDVSTRMGMGDVHMKAT